MAALNKDCIRSFPTLVASSHKLKKKITEVKFETTFKEMDSALKHNRSKSRVKPQTNRNWKNEIGVCDVFSFSRVFVGLEKVPPSFVFYSVF